MVVHYMVWRVRLGVTAGDRDTICLFVLLFCSF